MRSIWFVFLLTFTACSQLEGRTFWTNYAQIQVGMTKEEVIKILGPPNLVTHKGNLEILGYTQVSMDLSSRWVNVPFLNGRVSDVLKTLPGGN